MPRLSAFLSFGGVARFRAILRELQPLLKTDPRSPVINWYAGVSASATGDLQRAARHMGLVAGNPSAAYRNQRQFAALTKKAFAVVESKRVSFQFIESRAMDVAVSVAKLPAMVQ